LNSASSENDSLTLHLTNDLPAAMVAVQEQALSGNFVGFFEILNNAQIAVDQSRGMVLTTNLAARNLAVYVNNSDIITDDVQTEVVQLETETLYYSALITDLSDQLDQTLTGNIPSQDLFDEIDRLTIKVNDHAQIVTDQYLVLLEAITS
jgi:hypothetical protein